MEHLLFLIFKYSLIIFCALLAFVIAVVLVGRRIEREVGDADSDGASGDDRAGAVGDGAGVDAAYAGDPYGLAEDRRQEEEKMAEAFICPDCFEPYDGVYCENCGYSNDSDDFYEDEF